LLIQSAGTYQFSRYHISDILILPAVRTSNLVARRFYSCG